MPPYRKSTDKKPDIIKEDQKYQQERPEENRKYVH